MISITVPLYPRVDEIRCVLCQNTPFTPLKLGVCKERRVWINMILISSVICRYNPAQNFLKCSVVKCVGSFPYRWYNVLLDFNLVLMMEMRWYTQVACGITLKVLVNASIWKLCRSEMTKSTCVHGVNFLFKWFKNHSELSVSSWYKTPNYTGIITLSPSGALYANSWPWKGPSKWHAFILMTEWQCLNAWINGDR